ncbi:DUF1254 domain-containing protein [Streptomyces sp. NBC_01754]|uniref:DUF1254 domain-containing protein n=1 Tax=Streptomyces sp. NBC_01754 TaxID=2975930 RepID=UPI002DD9CC99|nr:DUF1254 domain-containing protein [Streptomyces sp. NBC_01754]WSC92252.1 DUF1254 domain-containing protein [Streptomyces sp. NBC_01754]
MGPDGAAGLAADAYVYGSALVRQMSAVRAGLQAGYGVLGPAPFNDFAHAEGPAVSGVYVPGAAPDLVDAIAQLDLSGGPVRLHVPDTGGVYYVLQFVDAWSNAFAYVGSRATGTREGDWLVVPPGWAGTVPDALAGVIDAPTSVVSLVGRVACHTPDDLPRVRALQQELTLTHLGDRPHRTGVPAPDSDVLGAPAFFERMRVWMADFPPAAADLAHQDRFQPLGLLEEGLSPYVSPGPALVRALTRGLKLGRKRVEAASRSSGRRVAWAAEPHRHDYNLDHLGVGTLASPRWRVQDRETAYLMRAVTARRALWEPHGYEAVSASTARDSLGRRLDGAHRYVLRLDPPPPVGAFWSVSAYEVPGGHLVTGPEERYATGDRSAGLVYDDGGALTLYVAAERPADPPRAANWLPAPSGGFRLVMRMYVPDQSVLDGEYVLPAVERA